MHSECPAPPAIWPCALSPYKNITPVPGVLTGPCKCTVAKQGLPENLLVYTYSALDYVDGASCHMRLPANGTMLAQPVFATEYLHDVLQLNGRNYSGIQREVGGIPPDPPGHPLVITDTNMYWWPDDRIVGTGWELVFSIPEPIPPPDPGSAPRVYSGDCMFAYNPDSGTGYLSNRNYMAGITVGHCIIIVPQGWYVSHVDFYTRSVNNTLSIGEQVYSGSAGPSVGLQLSGLVRWDAAHFVSHHDCGFVKPFRCGFYIGISKQQPQ